MLSGDLLVEDPRCRNSLRGNFKVVMTSKESEIHGLPAIVSLLVGLACGNDPFMFPYSFKCGVLPSILVCMLCVVLSSFAFKIYIESWIFGTDNSYMSIANNTFSVRIGWIFHVILILAYVGVAVGECSEISNGFSYVFSSLFSDVPSFLESKWVCSVLFPFILVIPLLFFPTFGRTLPISIINNVAAVIGIVSLLIVMIQKIVKEGFDPNKRINIWGSSMNDIIYCFDLFNTAFFIQPLIPMVASEMKNPTKERITKTFVLTITINSLVNLIAGFIGYFIFFDSISSGNCLQYLSSDSIFAIIAKFSDLIIAACITASFSYLISVEICRFLHPGSEERPFCRIFAGVVTLCFLCFFCILGNNATSVWNNIAAITIMLLGYIIPAMLYLRMHVFQQIGLGIGAVVLLVVVVALLLLSLISQL